MVGFKSIALLISLLFLAACVPQTKQTSCSTNEAFNATLRTCVPVMNGPSSFINIDSPQPSYSFARYKNDTLPVTLSILIDNPYAQTYSVVWEHTFLGNGQAFSPSTPTSHTFSPSFFSNELGTHLISVKIKDANLDVVAEHSWEFKIDDNPKPVIQSSTVTPALYSSTYTPSTLPQSFSFTVKNSGATMTGAGYRTDWMLYRAGVLIDTETDTFPTSSPAGSLSPSGFNYPVYVFDPLLVDGTAVGAYNIIARVTNNASEVVAEQQWSATVSHPALSKIIGRDIYSATTNPSFGTTSVAYNGIAYTSSTTYNFIPTSFAAQGDYCVTVSNGEGTYVTPTDGLFVRVDYYLDGASLIYSGLTTAVDNKICLTDAAAATLNNVIFTNASTTSTQSHTLVARVVDEATGQEYTLSDMNGSLGTYPVTWNFSVKPSNAAPTVAFTAIGNLSGIICGSATATAQTCTVTQDAAFTLGITATDDFYSTSSTTDTVQNKFTYTMTLLRNGSPVSTCTKTITDVSDGNAVGTDFVGPDYLCSFTAASSDVNGSINPALNTYSVAVVFSDVGSPISGSSPMSGTTLTYNLNVIEANTVPTIVAQANTVGSSTTDSYMAESGLPSTVLNPGTAAEFITEGQTLNVNIRVNDTEMDDHQVQLYLCTDFTSTCSTTSLKASQTVLKTNNTSPTLTTLTYALPEDLIPITTPVATNVTAYFKVVVTDIPDIVSGLPTQTTTAGPPTHFRVNVRNENPAPQFSGTPSPLVATSLTTMVGYPLTIDPGTVTDASIPATENAISYQWYIDPTGGDNSFQAITGATYRILRWTPSNALTAGISVNLALCVSDGTTINSQPSTATVQTASYNPANGPNCLQSWDVTVRPNAVALNYDNGALDVGSDVDVWQDNTAPAEEKVIYSASVDSTGVIFVEKTVFDGNGVIYNNSTNGFKTVSFPALRSGTQSPASVKDISITGTTTHLYIAYQAADSSTPSSPKMRVRRIDKRYGIVSFVDYGSKILHIIDPINGYPHAGKFGFTYDNNPTLTTLLPMTTSPNIDIQQASGLGTAITVDFTGDLVSGQTLTTNGIAMTADDAPLATELCSGTLGACTTPGNAARYESFINLSVSRLLQGVSAFDNGSSGVSIYGALNGSEYLDENPTVANYIVGKLGKIVIIGGTWYLPFVDLTSAATLGQIRVLSAGALEADVLNSTLSTNDTIVYSSIGAVNWFTNEIDPSGNMVIAAVNTSNIAQLHRYTTLGVANNTPVNLFNGSPVNGASLRMSAPVAGNNYHYVAAKVLTILPATYEWSVGRYDASFVLDYTNTVSNLGYNAATITVLAEANVKDVSIETYPSLSSSLEARLMVTSTAGVGTTKLYAVRFRNDNELSCDYCTPINITSEVLSASKRIATTKIDLDMTIGSAGSASTATENIRDVLFAVYPVSTSGGIYKSHLGIFNMEIEAINSNSSDTTGLLGHRPPFIGQN